MVERSKLKYFSKVGIPESPSSCIEIVQTVSFQGKLKWDEDSSAGRHVRRKVSGFLIILSLVVHNQYPFR